MVDRMEILFSWSAMVDDDDELVLSSAAQAALTEFLAEKEARESKLQSSARQESISIDSFPEDWQVWVLNSVYRLTNQLSQFWYDDETAEALVKKILHNANADTVIAIISAPSIYAKMKVFLDYSEN